MADIFHWCITMAAGWQIGQLKAMAAHLKRQDVMEHAE
jgi:hypothetical protein